MRGPWRRAIPVRKAWELDPIRGVDGGSDALVVAVLVYRGVSSAEVDVPVTRLAERLGATVVLVGAEVGPVHGVEPARSVVAGCDPSTAPTVDYLVVPGGLGWKRVLDDDAVRSWLRMAARDARGILAISTGSLLLASVGRLTGKHATGHWLAEDDLAALGAVVETTRIAADDMGRVVTASGALAAASTIDELVERAQWSQWQP
ncbi:MAG: DJ-1/PfpI family protein [Ilumatobacter sp.]|uniref:DJ-1/PfpI family protein n=1 Tax=Ilumatobacter sp. TaxID=1967498 RepID=UPI00391C6209